MASTDSATEAKPAAEEAVPKADDAAPASAAGEETTTTDGTPPPKVPMPDRAAFEMEVEALKKLMASNKAQKAALLKKVEATKSGGTAETKAFRDARDHQNAIRDEMKTHQAEVKRLISMQTALREQHGKVRTTLRETRAEMRADEIDRRIAYIDDRLASEGHTLSLKEEKDLVKQRTDLNKQKRELGSAERDRTALEARKVALETEMDALKPRITEAREKQNLAYERLKAYTATVTAARGAMDGARKGVDETFARIKELAAENNAAFAKLKARQDAHYDQLRKARAYKDWEWAQRKKEREERYKAEQAAYAAEEAQAEADAEASKPDHPWAVELVELDMLIHFLSGYASAASGSGEAKEETPAPAAAASGTRAASVEAALGDFGSTGSPKAGRKRSGRKRSGRGGSGRGGSGRGTSGDVEISLDFSTLSMFSKFKLEPPLLASQAAASLEAVTALKAEYQDKPAPPKAGSKPAGGAAAAPAADE